MSHPIRLFFELLGSLAALLLIGTGVLLWRLSAGPITVPFVTPMLEAALAVEGSSITIDVGETSLDWSGSARSIQLRVTDLRALGPDGAEIARIPQAWLSLSASRLLRGELQPEAFRVVGLRLSLTRAADGTLRLVETAASPAGDSEPADAPGIAAFLLEELTGPIDNDKPLGLLAEAIFADATIEVDDTVTGLRFAAEHADIRLKRESKGVALSAAVPVALGGQRLRLDAAAFYVAQNEALDFEIKLRGVSVSGLATLDKRLAALRGIDATADLQLWSRIGLDGKLDEVHAVLDSAAMRVAGEGWFARPVTIDKLAARARVSGDFERAALDDLQLTSGATQIRLSAELADALAKPKLTAKAEIAGLTVDALKRLWPLFASPNARDWVAGNIEGGRIPQAKGEFDLRSADTQWSDVAVDRAKFDFTVEGASVVYIEGLPPVTGLNAAATLDARRMEIRTRGGAVGELKLADGVVTIAGLDRDLQNAAIDVRIAGPAVDALRLVDMNPLGFLSRIGEDPANFGGAAEIRLGVRFPLLAALKFDDIAVAASGKVAGFAQRKAVLGQPIEDGNVDFRVDAAGLDIEGKVRLAGADAQIAYRREFADKAEPVERASASGLASTRSQNLLGFDFAPYAVGPAGISLRTQAFRDGRRDIDIELDLAEVAFAVPDIDWTRGKAKDTKAKMRLALRDETLLTIAGLDLSGDGMAIKGDIAFAGDGRTFRSADLTRLRLDGRIDLDATHIEREPRAVGVNLRNRFEGRGAFLDAAPFLRDKSPPEPGRPDLSLKLDVAKLGLGEGRELSALTLDGLRGVERWQWLDLRARTAAKTAEAAPGDVRVTIQPGDDGLLRLDGRATDAGALIAALDITPNVVGGTLALEGKEDPARPDRAIVGKAGIDEFRVVNAPGFAKLLSVALLTGILDSLQGEGIGFRRLDADFAWADPKIEIKEGRMHGAALGLTARGLVDMGADTVELDGTIVPAYAVNSILGNIPLLGNLLVGERGSGVFAANFRAAGPMGDIQTSVNPLSTLTPGFLRRMFGIFSGGGTGDTGSVEPFQLPTPNDGSMR